ncbi:MAG: lytic transglycosylase domain-containing protein [Deltaproteobacteria bacterium]|nr:lytic transglycosylase domain-containing protein [Deltaproteobacteria bacterium]
MAFAVAGLLVALPRHLGAAGAIPADLRTKPVHAIASIYDAVGECRSTLSDEKRWQIADAVESNARRYGFDPLFVQAMVEVESTCSPTAKSPRGALGLIQVRPSTARAVALEAGLEWSGSQKLLEPDFNVNVGLAYLNQLGEHFDDPHVAIAAYNLGPTRVANMPESRVRKSRYVRNVLARYQHLLDQRAT